MLTAVLGVVAALAFVLGLGAICLWGLKRWGAGPLRARTRVAVEVVQRIPLGPKTGLAVVRVGDKVMAVSVGDGGVRPLFELDEADRQRVIATSSVPLPLDSSREAEAAFASLTPASFGSAFGSLLGRSLQNQPVAPTPAAVQAADAVPVAPSAPASTTVQVAPALVMPSRPTPGVAAAPFSLTEASEVPTFLTAPPTTSRGTAVTYGPRGRSMSSTPVAATGDRDFRSMLGVSLSGATRLAVLAGAMLLLGAPLLRAQGGGAGDSTRAGAGNQPVVPPPAPPVPPVAPERPAAGQANQAAGTPSAGAPSAGAPTAGTPTAAPVRTATPAQAAAAPQPPVVRTLDAPPLVPANRRATPGRAATGSVSAASTPAPPPRPGNGAQTTAQGAAPRRDMNRMQLDSMARANKTAPAASPAPIAADDAIMRMMPQMDVKFGGEGDGEGLRLNGTVGIVVMMGLLTLLPTLILMMTGFTRILIVLHFLKQAMGTQSAPPGQLLAAMALLLTGFVMGPTLSEVNRTAITPWLDGQMTQVEMMKTGVQPMRTFMLKQTRESDLKSFIEMSRLPRPATVDDVPLHVLMSAFVASELRTAFQIGFAIYLPFIIIDAVVASVLMSMGMMMLPPAMISLPFKLLLFVLVDGWSLTITSLVQSFK